MRKVAVCGLAVGLLLLGIALLTSGCGRTQRGDTGPSAIMPGVSEGYELRRFVVKAGPYRYDENIYLLVDSDSREAFLIDPGAKSEELEAYVRDAGVRIVAILNTHGHYDHIGANAYYRELYKVEVYASPLDAGLYLAQEVPVDPVNAPTRDIPARGELRIGELNVRVIPTPGHTAGSVCFLAGNMLLSGDTLFQASVGRTVDQDTTRQLIASIRDELLVLPPDTVVYSGHGDTTTIGFEKRNNEFLRER